MHSSNSSLSNSSTTGKLVSFRTVSSFEVIDVRKSSFSFEWNRFIHGSHANL